jgi:hypothetical protein
MKVMNIVARRELGLAIKDLLRRGPSSGPLNYIIRITINIIRCKK